MTNLKNVVWQAKAAWALFASVFKHEWTIEDYPIRAWPVAQSSHKSRRKPLPWTADVINWPGMSASAPSKQEALAALRKKFERFRGENPKLPRPGGKVPIKIEFVSSDRVSKHSELAQDFTKRILGIDWAWISDESSLWDFHEDETNDNLIVKIRDTYGVDVSDIASGNLADIFDRIRKLTGNPDKDGT